MVLKQGWIGDGELLVIVEEVLNGKIDRETLARQRHLSAVAHRHTLAYVGVTLMLATRYRLDDGDGVIGPLRDALYDLTYRGTWAEYMHNAGINSYTVAGKDLQIAAVQRELYPQGGRSQRIVLSPPASLRELVERYGNNPAVLAFLEDAGIQDEYSPEAHRRRAKQVVGALGAKHGRRGLEALLAETLAALQEE